MIRAVLLFKGVCKPRLLEKCNTIVLIQRNSLCEAWIKCSTVNEMFSDIELAINSGYPLEEVAFLTGLKIKGYAISREIVETNKQCSQSIEGSIEFEYYTPVTHWIKELNIKKISIDVKSRKAIAQLEKPISIEQLFDKGIRLLKPIRIPP